MTEGPLPKEYKKFQFPNPIGRVGRWAPWLEGGAPQEPSLFWAPTALNQYTT